LWHIFNVNNNYHKLCPFIVSDAMLREKQISKDWLQRATEAACSSGTSPARKMRAKSSTSLSFSLSLPPFHPTKLPTTGASARIRVMAYPIFFIQFYFVTPTSNFVYEAGTLHPSARCPPTRYVVFLLAFFLFNFLLKSSWGAVVFHPYNVTSPTIKYL
jgi:hypothetical protein